MLFPVVDVFYDIIFIKKNEKKKKKKPYRDVWRGYWDKLGKVDEKEEMIY